MSTVNTIRSYLRFDWTQRVEHWLLFASFTTLAITGLPQKFADAGWASTMIGWMGGIEMTRVIHHWAAILMLLEIVYHGVNLGYRVFVTRVRWSMFPQLQDAWDALNELLYNAGLRKQAPKYEHFNFKEKLEYWALIWGTIIMALTGFMLWNPISTSRIMAGDWIPVAKAAHGAEAILAVLSIVIWHFYNVHLKILNKAMFNGQMNEHHMAEEHALELERLQKGQSEHRPTPEVIQRRQRVYGPIALIFSLALLFGVYLFTSAETTAVTTIPPQQTVQIFVPRTATPRAVTPTSIARPTGVGTSVATQPAVGVAKALPASHAGRTTCNACHLSGLAGSPKNPADHANRGDATCSACHKPAGTSLQPATPAPSLVPSAKFLPASHAGRTICLACHTTGVGGAPKNPADHAGRLDASCSDCHKQK